MDKEVNLQTNRYQPQHPLPEEIREMARDDTVCHFCGVSYLIHNEIKNLQEQLEVYKNEVERLKGFNEREKRLNDQVAMLTVKSNDLVEKWEIEVKRSNEHEELILQKNVDISQLKSNIENYKDLFNSEKVKAENLTRQLQEVAGVILNLRKTSKGLQEELSNLHTSYRDELYKFTLCWNEQKTLIIQKVGYFVKLYNTGKEDNEKIQYDMECRSNKYKKKMQDAEIKYERQTNVLELCSKSLLGYQSRIRLYDQQIGQFYEKHSQLAQDYSRNIARLNKKIHLLRTHIESVLYSQDYDRKSLSSSIEKYKQDNVRLNEERSRMVNAHQHQIKQLHESFMEKLLDAEQWPAKFDQKMKELQEKFDEEKDKLLNDHKESLKHAAEEHTEEYKLVNKSKDKYKQEVKKLEEKLKTQQRKFNEEKSQLLKQVTESYEKAAGETEARYAQMNEEKENHLNIIHKVEQQLESMQVKFHGEMLKQVEQHEKEKRNMMATFDNKISELGKQLDEEKSSKTNISNKENNDLVGRIDELEKALSNAKEVINEKKNCIEENRSEITSLRDCVRRECEERFELTESLAEARTELLSLQRFGDNYNSPKKLASHPLIYNNQTNKPREIKSQGKSCIKLEELSKSYGNLDGSKTNLDVVSTSPGSVKSQKSGGRTSSSGPRYSKNKLRISLKNN